VIIVTNTVTVLQQDSKFCINLWMSAILWRIWFTVIVTRQDTQNSGLEIIQDALPMFSKYNEEINTSN